jgi:hypothetical protein
MINKQQYTTINDYYLSVCQCKYSCSHTQTELHFCPPPRSSSQISPHTSFSLSSSSKAYTPRLTAHIHTEISPTARICHHPMTLFAFFCSHCRKRFTYYPVGKTLRIDTHHHHPPSPPFIHVHSLAESPLFFSFFSLSFFSPLRSLYPYPIARHTRLITRGNSIHLFASSV